MKKPGAFQEKSRLKRLILLLLLLIGVVSLFVEGLTNYFAVKTQVLAQSKSRVESFANILTIALENAQPSDLRRILSSASADRDVVSIWLLNPPTGVDIAVKSLISDSKELSQALKSEIVERTAKSKSFVTVLSNDLREIYAGVPILLADGGAPRSRNSVLLIQMKIDRIRSQVNSLRTADWFISVLGISLILLCAVWLLQKQVLNPLGELMRVVTLRSSGHRGVFPEVNPRNDFGHFASRLSKLFLDIEKNHALILEQQNALNESAIVAVTDGAGKITYVNDQLCQISGYTREELIGRDHRVLNSGTHPKEFFRELWQTIGGGKTWKGEICNRRKNGELYWVDSTIVPNSDISGRILGFTAIRYDISSRKHYENALIEARDLAQSAAQAKSSFLAAMSHEIRTPINGVIGMSGLLGDTKLDQQQREYVDAIKHSGENLLTIINDILDFSKIEAGRLNLELIPFDLNALLNESVRIIRTALKAKELELRVDSSLSSDFHLLGDPSRIRQVLLNLLSNAVKFTHKGTVSIRVRTVREDEQRVSLRIEVEDQGISISDEGVSKLFTAFSQADASISRRYGGTGLGLAICKQLVELMGGSIDVRSQLNSGTTFGIQITFAKVKRVSQLDEDKDLQPLQTKPTGRSDIRILIAEDNAINQRIAIRQLEQLGYRADAVADGKEALDALLTIPYNLVLMDCQMPELDGFEATRSIRNGAVPKYKDIPIIAMTANAIQGDREKCLEAGMNDYISKPVSVRELSAKIEKWLVSKKN